MPRRSAPKRRQVVPDAKYGNRIVSMFLNKLMVEGRKSLAERIVYEAFDKIEEREKRDPIEVFEQAVQNATPVVETKPRRVGGATYQVPVDIRAERRMALALRWILQSARGRRGRTMADKLADELTDAAKNEGVAIKKKTDTHRMAEANRAFAHFRW